MTPHLMTPAERRGLPGRDAMDYELVGVPLRVREYKGRPVLTSVPRSVVEAIYRANGAELWGWRIRRATEADFAKGFTWKAKPPERINAPGDKEEVGVGGTELPDKMKRQIEHDGRSRHEARDAHDRYQLDGLLHGIFNIEMEQRPDADRIETPA